MLHCPIGFHKTGLKGKHTKDFKVVLQSTKSQAQGPRPLLWWTPTKLVLCRTEKGAQKGKTSGPFPLSRFFLIYLLNFYIVTPYVSHL